MKCRFCPSEQSKVIDKRAVKSLGEIRRRRECLKCHKRFTTYERISQLEAFVIKRDGRREIFSKDKLRFGLEKALASRPDIDKAAELTDKIEAKLLRQGKKEISTKIIGQQVLMELKRLDKVAYLRFASVYRDFKEVGDFERELQGLN